MLLLLMAAVPIYAYTISNAQPSWLPAGFTGQSELMKPLHAHVRKGSVVSDACQIRYHILVPIYSTAL